MLEWNLAISFKTREVDSILSISADESGHSAAPLLEARNIGRRNTERQWLFNNYSLRMKEGESIALTGATGAGKTVFIRALSLLDPLDAGDVRWMGEPIDGDAVPEFRRKVIYLHQQPALFPGTVEENLRLPFQFKSASNSEFDRQRVQKWFDIVGRDASFLTKQQSNLSGGERQLVCLIRSIQLDPSILLLDEPTASLDPETTELAETLVREWLSDRSGKRSYLWVTHDPDQAERMAARLLRMTEKELKEDN